MLPKPVKNCFAEPVSSGLTANYSEIRSAGGSLLHSSSGKQFIDFSSDSFIYQHPALIQEAKNNLQEMSLSVRMFFSGPLAKLVNKLADIFPGSKAVAYPCNTVSEAVEGALKLAIGYHKGRKHKIIAASGSSHGNTLGALSISGLPGIKEHFKQLPLSVSYVDFGDATAMVSAIDHSVAAVVVEPVQLFGSFCRLPKGYLAAVKKACIKNGCLFIINESFTGFGRSGNWFAWQAENALPDILVTGNILGGNIVPYGAYIADRAINNVVYKRKDPALHGATTAGYPLGCVIANTVINLLEAAWASGSIERSGQLLLTELEKVQADFQPVIKKISVEGMAAGICAHSAEMAKTILGHARKNGLLLHSCETSVTPSPWLVLCPPMLTPDDEIRKGVSILAQCCNEITTIPTPEING